jgi:ribosomal protein S16
VAGSFLDSLYLAAANSRRRRDGNLVERIGDSRQVPAGEMQIDDGVPDIAVAEQLLDGREIGAGVQQVRGKAVAPMPSSA